MKVLYLLNYAGKAGTERYVETLVTHLAGRRIQPFFAYNLEGLLVERLQALGVPTQQLTMDSRFDRKAARALARLCAAWDIDLIHTHYLRENYIAMLAKDWNKHIKVVYTNHFILANDLPTRLSNRLLDRRQDAMIAVCNKGREQLIANGWSPEKITVVFNGVDPESWQEGGSTLRQELGLDDGRFLMLCASRFADDKGHPFLIRAVKALTQRTDAPFTLLLAGDGELLEPMKALAAQLGLGEDRLRFLGFRRDMKNLYKGVDLYVNSSRHEALSFLIIEAMAAGLPCIATDIAGNPDILGGPDQGGLLVPYDDPDALAGAMLRLLEDADLRRRCAQNAQANIRARFDIGKLAEDTYRVYERAVTGR